MKHEFITLQKRVFVQKKDEIVTRIIFSFYAFHNVSIIQLLSKSQFVRRINVVFFGPLAKICWDSIAVHEFYVSLVFCALRSTTSKKDPSKESVEESQMRQ